MLGKIKSLSNLQQRLIAGFIGGFIVISLIYWSKWGYFFLFFILCFLAQVEFYNIIINSQKRPNKLLGTFIGISIYTLTFLVLIGYLNSRLLILIFPVLAIIFINELYNGNKEPFNNVAYTILGIVYVSIPFTLIHCAVLNNNSYSYQIGLGCLFLLWSSDSGAYFAGKAFGKTKLFPSVSPGKTWEGSVGGALLAITTALVLSFYYKDLQWWQWVSLAIIIVVVGSYGDLVESSLKRSLSIKDSGSLIPGHGGLLDRFDGWLLASPFIAAFLEITRLI